MLRICSLFSYSHHGLALLHPNTTLVSKQQHPPTPPPVTVQPSQHRTAQHPTHHQLLLYLDHHPKKHCPSCFTPTSKLGQGNNNARYLQAPPGEGKEAVLSAVTPPPTYHYCKHTALGKSKQMSLATEK